MRKSCGEGYCPKRRPVKAAVIFLLAAAVLLILAPAVYCEEDNPGGILTPGEEREAEGYTVDLKRLMRDAERNFDKAKEDLRRKKTKDRGAAADERPTLPKADKERAKTAEMVERLEKIYGEMHKVEAATPPKPETSKTKEPSSVIASPRFLLSQESNGGEAIPEKEVTPLRPAVKALKTPSPVPRTGQGEDEIPPRQNVLLAVAAVLLILLIVVNASSGSKAAPAKKTKEFEPRDLRKYLNKKEDEADRDLFK